MHNNQDIGFSIRIVSNLIKRKVESYLSSKHSFAITCLQGKIAGYLYAHSEKDIFQKDLEDIFSVRRSTITEVLKIMEKNGLIEKKSVEKDARLKKIVITKKAIDLHLEILEDIKEIEKIIKKDISEEELALFMSVLNKIKKNIE